MKLAKAMKPKNLPAPALRRASLCRGGLGVDHRLLLRIGCAQLEDLGEALLGRLVGLGDGGIDVWHSDQ
jgi:hypothetical protein